MSRENHRILRYDEGLIPATPEEYKKNGNRYLSIEDVLSGNLIKITNNISEADEEGETSFIPRIEKY